MEAHVVESSSPFFHRKKEISSTTQSLILCTFPSSHEIEAAPGCV